MSCFSGLDSTAIRCGWSREILKYVTYEAGSILDKMLTQKLAREGEY